MSIDRDRAVGFCGCKWNEKRRANRVETHAPDNQKGPGSIHSEQYGRVPRRPRIDFDGVPLHVVQGGDNREPCFYGEDDYASYLHSHSELHRV